MTAGREAMTAKQKQFVEEYLVDMNATQAAKRAGYSEDTAYSIGFENLKKPEIQEAIAELRAERSKRLEVTADDVLRQLWAVATADPNELIEFRRVCCKDCFGEADYHPEKDPNPDCKSCYGQGVGTPFPKDTRKLSPHARRLFAGVKITKEGIELKVRDQDAALRDVGRHLGMFTDRATVEVIQKAYVTFDPSKDLH